MITRVVLIGFSGTGKSSTGHLVADRLGWSVLEMDDEIERREAMSIPEIFDTHGEERFRRLEADLLQEGLSRRDVVISTGGGAVCSEEAWDAIRAHTGTLVVGFEATPEEIQRRIESHAALAARTETTRRPMLDADDPLARIRHLLSVRQEYYRRADVTIHVGSRPPEVTARDIAEMVSLANGVHSSVTLKGEAAESRIIVGPGSRDALLERLAERWPKARRIWVGADEHVADGHAEWLATMVSSDFDMQQKSIPSGEGSKSLGGLGDLYDWMICGGVERNDVAVAAGGGVTGDLVGFAAATTLRGIGLVQVPTTLLSMVDSSVGGKTGINHADGKNLIGAFYQPPLVVVDSVFLKTLPQRELRSGFAEVIKHAVIQGSTPGGEGNFLLNVLEQNADALLRLEEPLTSWVIRQNISLKAAVVEADEKESHLRQILNFGHTIGHGIEAEAYSLLHGEAIAVGMVAAMEIGVAKGMVEPSQRDRLVALLAAYGLPTNASFNATVVKEKMSRDKKKSSGVQQWVLPLATGGVEIRTDVPETLIDHALSAVLRPLILG
jgi:shikimate kinase / 3-dehydroquinate synthase